ncbi:orotidine-5'-phosphate decarboxylase [Salsuginibacillus halophilus]|uniref:Orotidine 5'-phosphate decarboxylase n=1 Tax=Salsuginibacillus halophilus TaxID=517424 RepID=A0A2P8HX55_9BACI|nr:orotidine-5'-phosphate decarboxylase [Salsuginibacillus halophilus]PSL50745.1 orotidine-5'-phosphate decarboxylase [Salsuginibacillus halophilus]
MMKDPILALDVPNEAKALKLLEHFKGESIPVKIGMELFYRTGASFIESLTARGHPVFLDLKLHDIPTTVERAMINLASLGVSMVNVHAAGGADMMRAAVRGLEAGTPEKSSRPLCLAVTQLTSTDESMLKKELLIKNTMQDTVAHYAANAAQAGLDGVVCSSLEASLVQKTCGSAFLRVTPGIRQASDEANDQVRSTTPSEARAYGSTHIVIGRSVTKSEAPAAAYDTIRNDWRSLS